MSDEDFIVWMFGKQGEGNRKNLYSDFWKEVTSSVTDRPNRAVRIYIRRMYQPKPSNGSWSSEEQEKLEA